MSWKLTKSTAVPFFHLFFVLCFWLLTYPLFCRIERDDSWVLVSYSHHQTVKRHNHESESERIFSREILVLVHIVNIEYKPHLGFNP
jgi:hypothetical protein